MSNAADLEMAAKAIQQTKSQGLDPRNFRISAAKRCNVTIEEMDALIAADEQPLADADVVAQDRMLRDRLIRNTIAARAHNNEE